ncbi:10602_t:CDS:2 [Funneliformis caledonium]|uniref:10602_t:CDS:1 n=1 Tax=Funneliformis caledonium TaxID=1117310 RepID=A0A9N9DP69_9GLOM|nr:10602_t:CDS:2 [Funneliformis caledonium]
MSKNLHERALQIKQYKGSDIKYIPAVDLHNLNLKSAKSLVIKTIQEYYSTEVTWIRFITGRGNHLNAKGKRAILYNSFPTWITDVKIHHLIEDYDQGDGSYKVYLKTSKKLKEESSTITILDVNVIRQEVFKRLETLAETGNVDSQLLIGQLYFDGVGINIKEKHEQAFKWFIKAAEQGDVGAQLIVGNLLHEGKGVARNYREAFKWLLKAAKQNNVSAQIIVAKMYFNGEGIKKSDKEAFKWIKMAAVTNNPNAQFILEQMCAKGEGVKQKEIEFREIALKKQWHTLIHFSIDNLCFNPTIFPIFKNLQKLEITEKKHVCLNKGYYRNLSKSKYSNLQILITKNITHNIVEKIIEKTNGYLWKIDITNDMHEKIDHENFIKIIYQHCPNIKLINILIHENKNLLELEQLLLNCQYLEGIVIESPPIYRSLDERINGNELLEIITRSAPIGLHKIKVYKNLEISLNSLITFFDNWRGRMPLYFHTIMSYSKLNKDYLDIIEKYEKEGILKEYKDLNNYPSPVGW